jgi:competence protein ComEC
MSGYGSYFWKKAPFIRLLIAMIAGILLQWHYQLAEKTWWAFLFISLLAVIIFFFVPFFNRYRLFYFPGVFATFLFLSFGALLTFNKDIRNDKSWLGNFYKEKDGLIVTLDEPLVEKTKSYKVNAKARWVTKNGKAIPVYGTIIIYFKKDSSLNQLKYGSQILFTKSLQEIKNSGNPGGFDYKRYSLFQGVTHQVYLKPDEFEVLPGEKQNPLREFIYSTRRAVLSILRNNIAGDKELGLAEALLIGYKNDLEQSLVQSYTNTGVVHIIAISGLHLGLIYWLLALLLNPLKNRRKVQWLRPVLIITGLWLFSILAGAQPSILRSAIMFTCIVLGESLSKRTSIYNTMAVSAFILLCINPYWLWDVGFQLSYAAVLSIIIFIRPIYNWFYIKNKILDFIWKLNAVTLAAQILSVPLSIYHFHQFPNYFLLTNFLAVPVSSIIVLGEIFLCAIAWVPAVATLAGKLLSWMIWLMNTWIERVETLRFSLWDGLQINILQTILLVILTAGISYWLMPARMTRSDGEKAKRGLTIGLIALFGLVALRSFSFITAELQQKIIVYNVPQKRAIDFVDGRHYTFVGDSDLFADDFAPNFHLKPTRILYRITPVDSLTSFSRIGNYTDYKDKKILMLDSSINYLPSNEKPVIDLLVISKNPRIYISKLATRLNIRQIVFDGSVPSWKTVYWKKDCDSLHIPWHDVTTQGAFVMNMR